MKSKSQPTSEKGENNLEMKEVAKGESLVQALQKRRGKKQNKTLLIQIKAV
jgi:hypothetical protein